MNGLAARLAGLDQRRLALFATELQARLEAAEAEKHEPVAIVGMACRFPGGANTPAAYWDLLIRGVDATSDIPLDRFDVEPVYDPTPGQPGTTYTRRGGFLKDVDIAGFDARFFGIAPSEVVSMDPQQRLLLELAWEALEHAGLPVDVASHAPVGVFVGMSSSDYARATADAEAADGYALTGNAFSVASGRLSYTLGFGGPNLTVDTACSSSLVALHLACRSLRSQECAVALAGGVNLLLAPDSFVQFCQLRALSKDGRCKTFDASADGFGRAEGGGVVVLKRLRDALRDGDRVLAVVLGSAVNHDGRSSGLTVPNGPAQQALIQQALADAAVAPHEVGYVEAHGTGTVVGDPIEVGALGAVYGQGRNREHPLLLGSAKTVVGHLEAAAGMAGLLKLIHSFAYDTVPPHLHLRQLNPSLNLDAIPAAVPTVATPWPAGRTRRIAGINAFGIGGTNAHVIVAEPPRVAAAPAPRAPASDDGVLLPLSARGPEALRASVAAWRAALTDPQSLGSVPLGDIGYTAAVRRSHHRFRLAVSGSSHAEVVSRLGSWLEQHPASAPAPASRPKVTFVFPGQGSQWVGMGQRLLQTEPVFRAAIERCEAAMRPYVDWSLLAVLEEARPEALEGIDRVQPVLCAVQIALAALWRAWGVEPSAVVGHSMGEVAAAHVAGALTIDDAMRIICRRSRLMRRLSGQGAMVSVELSARDAAAAIRGREEHVSVAVSNSRGTTVLSGERSTLEQVVAELEARDVVARWINVDVASHSPQMDRLREELLAALQGINPQPAGVPITSTVLGSPIAGPEMTPAYWVNNLRHPVLFASAIEQLAADGHQVFLEVSPHPILLPAIQSDAAADWTLVPSLRRAEDERTTLLRSLGTLYERGVTPQWAALFPAKGSMADLPTYPWQRTRFWPDAQRVGRPSGKTRGGHPLLQRSFRSLAANGQSFWEVDLETASFPYLADHRVRGAAIFPTTAYLEMVAAAAHTRYGDAPVEIAECVIGEAFFVPDTTPETLQLTFAEQPSGDVSFNFSSAGGREHARGTVRRKARATAFRQPPAWAHARMEADQDGPAHYLEMAERGLQYGPAFQGVTALRRVGGEALGHVTCPEMIRPATVRYVIHPGLLDAYLQVVVSALPSQTPRDRRATFVPVGIERVHLSRLPQDGRRLTAQATVRSLGVGDTESFVGELVVLDDVGQVFVELEGITLRRLAPLPSAFDPWLGDLFTQTWQRLDAPAPAQAQAPAHSWLILADRSGFAEQLALVLEARGQTCTLLYHAGPGAPPPPGRQVVDPTDEHALAATLQQQFPTHGPQHLVYCWTLDAPRANDDASVPGAVRAASRLGPEAFLALLRLFERGEATPPPQVVLVTRGAQQGPEDGGSPDPGGALVWGLGRVAAHERPDLHRLNVDLFPTPLPGEVQQLADVLLAERTEDELLLRPSGRYAARLAPLPPSASSLPMPGRPVGGTAFQLRPAPSGLIEGAAFVEAERPPLPAGHVEIEVQAASVNFRDVLHALGILPGRAYFGFDYAGRVSRVGPAVDTLSVGDEVLAFASGGLGRYVVADARAAVIRPTGLAPEMAVAQLLAYATALYSLRDCARLQPGERVLIHAASGGVGLAALHVARAMGADVLATAGRPEKRAFLQQMGVEHVMDSRALAFADEVLDATDGRGVDVVLNALSGAAVEKGLAALAPYGRFVELGLADIWADRPLPLSAFKKSLSYVAVDLAAMLAERPDQLGSLLRDVMAGIADGAYPLLPVAVYPIAATHDALQRMARAEHIGKLVISFQDLSGLSLTGPPAVVRSDATYLVVGGLGGLGRTTVEWLLEQGARSVVVMGRRLPSTEAQASMDRLAARVGARVVSVQGDVAQPADLQRVLDRIAADLPPLRGVVHAAGTLADSPLGTLTPAHFAVLYGAKLDGAWALHTLTLHHALDFFFLYSSQASLLGSAGQGNYAAANAQLDALAEHRRAQGLPAVSINWGRWEDVGLAAALETSLRQRLANQGLVGITPHHGKALLSAIAAGGAAMPPRVGALVLDWPRYLQRFFETQMPSLFADVAKGLLDAASGTTDVPLVVEQRPSAATLRQDIASLPAPQRRPHVHAFVGSQLAQVLGYAPTHVLDTDVPFSDLGLDSLRAVELRNRLQTATGLALRSVVAFEHPTVADLGDFLLHSLGAAGTAPAEVTPPAPAEADDSHLLQKVSTLSDADITASVDAQLAALLAE